MSRLFGRGLGARRLAPYWRGLEFGVEGRGLPRPYVPLALGLFLCAALAHADDFSHKTHLALDGLECTTCHSKASKSASATDSLLPPGTVCESCHDGGSAPYVEWEPKAAAERIFQFNHEFHLGMGNVAPIIAVAIDDGKYLGYPRGEREHLNTEVSCVACHRGLDQAEKVDSSLHLPAMADCLVCHDQVDNPFSCEKCHDPATPLKPTDHSRDFVDKHSTGKMGFDKLTCQPCHGKKFTCMGCH